AGLEHADRQPQPAQAMQRVEPREPCADDDRVELHVDRQLWRSPTAADNVSSSARHDAGGAIGRRTNLEKPTARKRSISARTAGRSARAPRKRYRPATPPAAAARAAGKS